MTPTPRLLARVMLTLVLKASSYVLAIGVALGLGAFAYMQIAYLPVRGLEPIALWVLGALTIGSASSVAVTRAKREVGEDDYEQQQNQPRHSHQMGLTHGARALRRDTSDSNSRGQHHSKGKPDDPGHRLNRLICAARSSTTIARGISRSAPASPARA